MNTKKACSQILDQLTSLIQQLDQSDFIKPSHALSNSTIGQHLRHTLEFFFCLEKGNRIGIVNYDKRNHDKVIESDKFVALAKIGEIKNFVQMISFHKKLLLEVGYETTSNECTSIETNSHRELVYNIEHAVHHMAIMKIGVREVAPYVSIPDDFGVATSTVRYKQENEKAHS